VGRKEDAEVCIISKAIKNLSSVNKKRNNYKIEFAEKEENL
jgi:hypothetical protein